jgi:aarF domain-containing kinase
MSYAAQLLHQARKRPLLASGVSTMTAAVGLETYGRFVSGSTLPRNYDRDAIRHYWLVRPLSVAGRVGQILASLGPVGVRWYTERQLTSEESMEADRQQYHADQFRQALTQLGPAWVKGGQQLAIRPDLVPPVVLSELQKLCDSVTPVDDEIALQLLRDELGIQDLKSVFQNLKLMASASLGQVYQATLVKQPHDVVAIKVQRPGMRQAFSLDLFLLQQWGEFMDMFTAVFTNQQPYHRAFLDAFCEGSYSVSLYVRCCSVGSK